MLTGASSGIGYHLALQLAEAGTRLVVSARRQELLDELAGKIEASTGRLPKVIPADLSIPAAAKDVSAAALEYLGEIDVLVNNAGGGVGGAIWAVGDGDEAREAFEINLWSPMAFVHELVPHMRARGSGTVVNVTSMAQVTSWPGFGAYAATKAALGAVTEALRLELVDSGVHVLEVIPGPVATAVQGETRLLPGIDKMLNRVPLGDPKMLAGLTVAALRSGRRRVIYPRRTAVAYALPMLVRADTARLVKKSAREIDPESREEIMNLVARSGSQGDPIAREAREAWERSHPN